VQLADGTVLAAGGWGYANPNNPTTAAAVFHENVREYSLTGPGEFLTVPSASGAFQIGTTAYNGFSGPISFTVNGAPFATATVNPNPLAAGGVATLSYSNLVCASVLDIRSSTSDFNYWMSIYPNGPETALTPTPASATVKSGESAIDSIAIPTCTSAQISLTCSNLPKYASCSNPQVAINPAPLTTVSLIVATNAASSGGTFRRPRAWPSAFASALRHAAPARSPAAILWLLPALLALGLLPQARRAGLPRLRRRAMLVIACALLLGAGSCGRATPSNPGSGGASGGTPTGPSTAPGTYPITVTGKYTDFPSGNPVTVTTQVTLVVQ
jgi:hypothetical protein